ncbi:MAG: hypothetical protein R2939_06995 [Kofleriaceae bacterium]
MTHDLKVLVAGVIAATALVAGVVVLDWWSIDANIGVRFTYSLHGYRVCAGGPCLEVSPDGLGTGLANATLWLGCLLAAITAAASILPMIGVEPPQSTGAWVVKLGVGVTVLAMLTFALVPPGVARVLPEGSRGLGGYLTMIGAIAAVVTGHLRGTGESSMGAAVGPVPRLATPTQPPVDARVEAPRAGRRTLRPIEPIELEPTPRREASGDPFDPHGNGGGA